MPSPRRRDILPNDPINFRQTAMTEIFSITVSDEDHLQRLAQRLAAFLRLGDLVFLHGTLGVGKTVLARALIRAITDEQGEIPSPTYALVQHYEGPIPVFHYDLYRLERAEDFEELGFDDAHEIGVVLIEWAERARSLLPRNALEITIDQISEKERHVTFLAPNKSWQNRLSSLTCE